MQSLGFVFGAVCTLRDAGFLPNIYDAGRSLHDYGCAEGDGTAALASLLPHLMIKGFDISPIAVARAQQRWPTLPFEVGDIRSPKTAANVIWTSHTLEHLVNPEQVVGVLRQYCKWLIVLVPPTPGNEVTGPHIGAVPFEEWIDKVAVRPNNCYSFATTRQRRIHSGLEMCEESSRLLIWEGNNPMAGTWSAVQR